MLTTQRSYPAGSNIADVTTFGADPTGLTDSTSAILAARNWACPAGSYAKILYFPAGEYLVSQQISARNSSSHLWSAWFHFAGAGRDRTKIRLADNCSGFTNAASPLAVFMTGNQSATDSAGIGPNPGNQAFRNYVTDLTIDTGHGNFGAAGIDLFVSNSGGARSVRVTSGDDTGYAGIMQNRTWPGPGLLWDVEVDGFQYAWDTRYAFYSMVGWNLVFRNQTVAGIRNGGQQLTLVDWISSQSGNVPAYLSTAGAGTRIDIDGATLIGSGDTAIDSSAGGSLFRRNVDVQGYTNVSKTQDRTSGAIITTPVSTETRYEEATDPGSYVALSAGKVRSLGLKRMPLPPGALDDPDPTNWVFGYDASTGASDSTNDKRFAIQTAFNSGATVFLPESTNNTTANVYSIFDGLFLPGTLRRVIGATTTFKPITWPNGKAVLTTLNDGGMQPLVLENVHLTGTGNISYAITKPTDVAVTAGSNVATSPGGAFTSAMVGAAIVVGWTDSSTALTNPDAYVPCPVYISSFTNANTVTLSRNAVQSGTGLTCRIGDNLQPPGSGQQNVTYDYTNFKPLNGWGLDHASARPLVLIDCNVGTLRLGKGCGPVLAIDTICSPVLEPGTYFSGVQVNMEQTPGARAYNDGGTIAIAGYKTEQFGAMIKTVNGGRTEILGAQAYPVHGPWSGQAAWEVIDSDLFVSGACYANIPSGQSVGTAPNVLVKETRNGTLRQYLWSDLPVKGSYWIFDGFVSRGAG